MTAGESIDDAVRGCLGIGLRRASMFSRAPVVHDLTIAFTIWGFLDRQPHRPSWSNCAASCSPAWRTSRHSTTSPCIVDMVPEATLRMTPQQVDRRVSGAGASWSALTR